MTLRDFQNAFADALVNPESSALSELAAQPGFAVYRNTVLKGCIDALQANYPAVTRLVGETWFRAAAAYFVRSHPPQQPLLVDYGKEFAAFLETFAPAAELPYLPDVARVDRFWSEAHVAADDACVQIGDFAALDEGERGNARLRLHASARWRWFPTQPIHSIWRGNRDDNAPDMLGDIEWRGEGVLLVRPHGVVEALDIGAAECAFLDACQRGGRLNDAAVEAAAVDASADLGARLARLVRAGAFAAIEY